VSSYS